MVCHASALAKLNDLVVGALVMQSDSASRTSTGSTSFRLFEGPRRLWFGRSLWFAVAAFVVVWLLMNIPPSLERFGTVCLANDCPTFSLYPGASDQLAAIGLTVSQYALLIIVFDLLVFAAFSGPALLIFFYRADDHFGWLIALALLIFGVGIPQSSATLQSVYPATYALLILLGSLAFLPILFLFPDGRFIPQWNWLFGLLQLLVSIIYIAAAIIPRQVLPSLIVVLLIGLAAICLMASLYGQFYRYRFVATPEQREQLRWAVIGLIGFIVSSLLWGVLFERNFAQGDTQPDVIQTLLLLPLLYLASAIFPMGLCYAVFRHRLWEIEAILNPTLVYSSLTAIIAGLYILIVGGLSAWLHLENNVIVSLFATGTIAVIFQPVRAWLQHLVNQHLFGERDNPLHLLSELGTYLVSTSVPGAIMPDYVATIANSLRLNYVAIYGQEPDMPLAAAGSQPDNCEYFPLSYHKQHVGTLVVSTRDGNNQLSRADRRLLQQIASQAAAAVYSLALLRDLQLSRERLVTTREEERLRIRRDLHDSLGPLLATQGLKLSLAQQLLNKKPTRTEHILKDLVDQNERIIAEIRHLVYALRPPALDELGLVATLRQEGALVLDQVQLTVKAEPDPLRPLPAAVEVATYRIVMEALTNVARHANASHCQVGLLMGQELEIYIEDDGKGIPTDKPAGVGLHSMYERVSELGGTLTVTTGRQKGTRISVTFPLPEEK